MTYDRSGTGHGGGKEYKQEIYKCTHDDTWVTVETPKEE